MLNILVLILLPLVPVLKKNWGVGMYGSKVKVANLVLLRVIEYSAIAKSTLVGAGHDIWWVLKEDPKVLEGPLKELSGEDIKLYCPVLLAITILMI
jgi:hypothetical protein